MLKKTAAVALFAASAFISLPTAAVADDFEACMLNSGCFYVSGNNSDPGRWECPSPKAFMLCLSPDTNDAGGVSLLGIKD